VLGTSDDVTLVLGVQFDRADTGAGGLAGGGSDIAVVLAGGGLLVLGAAICVRRASLRGIKA